MFKKPYMFRDAVNDYMHWFRINGKTWLRTKQVIDAFIIKEFGHIKVEDLTTADIRNWMDRLVVTPARQKVSEASQQCVTDFNEEALRKRKVTINRYLAIVKAILNKAYQDGKVSSDIAWKRVKPFRKVDTPRVEYFELDEITRFVKACPPDFRILVCGALYTGCRYSELARMKKRDFNPDAGHVYVQFSKSGKSRYVTLTAEGLDLFTKVCADKEANDLIFIKSDSTEWKHSHQARPFKTALSAAGINKNASFHSLRHTHASQLAMQGVELNIIARQLGHYDSRMAERHYAHLSPSYISERIRSRFPSLGLS